MPVSVRKRWWEHALLFDSHEKRVSEMMSVHLSVQVANHEAVCGKKTYFGLFSLC